MIQCAKDSGYQLLVAEPQYDSAGVCVNGLAILAKWPVQEVAVEVGMEHYCMLCRVHLPGKEPIMAANIHLSPGDAAERKKQARKVQEKVASFGGERLILGDWNSTPEETPIVQATIGGGLHLSEQYEEQQQPTRWVRKGDEVVPGRHIDMAIHSAGIPPSARNQWIGVSDHDVIAYDFKVSDMEDVLAFVNGRPLKALEEDGKVTAPEWWQVYTRAIQAEFRT